MHYYLMKSIITLKTSFIIQTAKYLYVLKIAYQLTMVRMLSRTDRVPPRAVKTVIDATRYPADLQPVGQLYFTLVQYTNRGKTIIMSPLNMSLSNQEREETLSKWFDKVVGLMLPGINCIRR